MAKRTRKQPAASKAAKQTNGTQTLEIAEIEGDLPGQGIHKNGQVVLEVDPDNLVTDPDFQALRDWTGSSAHELKIPDLAKTIYEEGQRELCKAFSTDEGIVLYDGHRRREAVKFIRDEWDATWMLQVVVDTDLTRDRALRAALLAESQHEPFSPRARARNVAFLREHFGWHGPEGTARIADFLGVSPATISQDERLAKAPREVQDKVESGQLTVTTALELIASTGNLPAHVQADAQAEIAERAEEIAAEEKERRSAPLEARGEVEESDPPDTTSDPTEDAPPVQDQRRGAFHEPMQGRVDGKTDGKADKPDISRKHVNQAAAEVLGDQAKVKAWRIADAVQFFEPLTGPAYPDVMARFAGVFLDRCAGRTGDKQLEAAWDDIADEVASDRPAATKRTGAGKSRRQALQ